MTIEEIRKEINARIELIKKQIWRKR